MISYNHGYLTLSGIITDGYATLSSNVLTVDTINANSINTNIIYSKNFILNNVDIVSIITNSSSTTANIYAQQALQYSLKALTDASNSLLYSQQLYQHDLTSSTYTQQSQQASNNALTDASNFVIVDIFLIYLKQMPQILFFYSQNAFLSETNSKPSENNAKKSVRRSSNICL